MFGAAKGFGHAVRASFVIGCAKPRIAAAPIGSATAQYDHEQPSQRRSIDSISTPTMIAPIPNAWSGLGASCKKIIAERTANSGDRLASAPDTFGPIRRLASNVSNVTVAGKKSPTAAKM